MTGTVLMTFLVVLPFLLAAARAAILRLGRPAWLHRRILARAHLRPSGTPGLGMTAVEELQAFFNGNKRVQIEQRQTQLLLRDDDHSSAAPPRMGIDLEAGTAVIRRTGKQA
ncbi:DUF6191 domain-containing protein [Kitasatospora sp. NPDC093806]|uniref:DUF6191 domain-containing protein n=1 Tax=Kitasatospora sp. NPDC093806 TaxID=3155075 RepID=UPI003430E6E9